MNNACVAFNSGLDFPPFPRLCGTLKPVWQIFPPACVAPLACVANFPQACVANFPPSLCGTPSLCGKFSPSLCGNPSWFLSFQSLPWLHLKPPFPACVAKFLPQPVWHPNQPVWPNHNKNNQKLPRKGAKRKKKPPASR